MRVTHQTRCRGQLKPSNILHRIGKTTRPPAKIEGEMRMYALLRGWPSYGKVLYVYLQGAARFRPLRRWTRCAGGSSRAPTVLPLGTGELAFVGSFGQLGNTRKQLIIPAALCPFRAVYPETLLDFVEATVSLDADEFTLPNSQNHPKMFAPISKQKYSWQGLQERTLCGIEAAEGGIQNWTATTIIGNIPSL